MIKQLTRDANMNSHTIVIAKPNGASIKSNQYSLPAIPNTKYMNLIDGNVSANNAKILLLIIKKFL